MPAEKDHQALAQHNQDTIDYLLAGGDRFPDWIITVAFYKALHVIDAMFARHFDGHGVDHRIRGEYLKKDNRYRLIYRHYKALKEASSAARYLSETCVGGSYKTFTNYATMEDVKNEFLRFRLAKLEQSVNKLKPTKKQP